MAAADGAHFSAVAWVASLGLVHRSARYGDCLVRAGLSTPAALAAATDADLAKCGIVLPHHRRILLASAARGCAPIEGALRIQPPLAQKEVRPWLDSLDLSALGDALSAAGYASLADVVGATSDDLHAAGVALPGARKKIAISAQRGFAPRPASVMILGPDADIPTDAVRGGERRRSGGDVPIEVLRPSPPSSSSQPPPHAAPRRDSAGNTRPPVAVVLDSDSDSDDAGEAPRRTSGSADVFASSGAWELLENPLSRPAAGAGPGRRRPSDSFVGGGTHRFEVSKVLSQGFIRIPMTLVVDVECGTVTVAKKHVGLQSAITNQTDKPYAIGSVRQLIKSRSEPARLGVLFTGKVRKDYRFDSPRSRERFCELVQRMRAVAGAAAVADAADDEGVAAVSVLVGTWNMGNADPPSDITAWVRPAGRPLADICAFGTQEETFAEAEWTAMVAAACGSEYEVVMAHSLWYMRLVVLVRASLRNRVSHLQADSVATGIGNALGNKGAVAVSFHVDSSPICFVNCHLASGAENSARRNTDFAEIVRSLRLGRPPSVDVTARFHHLFWFGDLNYRVDMTLDDAMACVQRRDWPRLMAADQLSEERRCGRAFPGFAEREPPFAPTYRYARGTRAEFASRKVTRKGVRINVPSYCDRILSLSFPNLFIEQQSLEAVESITTSDHTPVHAFFSVGIARQFVAPVSTDNAEGADFPPAVIMFGEAICKVRAVTHPGSRYVLEIHSPCLGDAMRTRPNRMFVAGRPESTPAGTTAADTVEFTPTAQAFQGSVRPAWTESDFDPMPTMFPHPAYVRAQHLQIAVIDDGGAVLGQCVVSLACVIGPSLVPFSALLTQAGTCAGYLRGTIRVHIPKSLALK